MDADKLIKESLMLAESVKKSATKNVFDSLTKSIKEDIMKEFTTTPDVPAGFDIDGSQKDDFGASDTLEDKGAGPKIVEDEAEPDEDKIDEDEKIDIDEPKDKDKDDDDDLDLDIDVDESVEPKVDEPEDKDKKEVDECHTEDADKKLKQENSTLKTEIAKLRKENSQLVKSLKKVNESLRETSFINNKLALSGALFNKYNLKSEQKDKILDHLDKAKTISEMKKIYDVYVTVLKEHFNKVSTATSMSKKIQESVKSQTKSGDQLLNEEKRAMARLAGIGDELLK